MSERFYDSAEWNNAPDELNIEQNERKDATSPEKVVKPEKVEPEVPSGRLISATPVLSTFEPEANNASQNSLEPSTISAEDGLGQYVRKVRIARSMSQDELARIVGKSGAWVSKVENNVHRRLSPSSYRALASALGISVNDLIKMGGYRSEEEPVLVRHPAADLFLNFPDDITPEEVEELSVFLEVSREIKKRHHSRG